MPGDGGRFEFSVNFVRSRCSSRVVRIPTTSGKRRAPTAANLPNKHPSPSAVPASEFPLDSQACAMATLHARGHLPGLSQSSLTASTELVEQRGNAAPTPQPFGADAGDAPLVGLDSCSWAWRGNIPSPRLGSWHSGLSNSDQRAFVKTGAFLKTLCSPLLNGPPQCDRRVIWPTDARGRSASPRTRAGLTAGNLGFVNDVLGSP